MSKELYLVRHGKTMFNEKRVIQGWCDAPLTTEGEQQAARIGRYFLQENITFDHAYTSTLTRTQQTMERITDMPYDRVEDLREWGFGAFEGERVDLMPPFPWVDFYVPFGGEAQLDVRKRVCNALTDIMSRPDHEKVLVVSHGSACREFLTQWVPDGGYDRGGVPGNCSIMRFTFEDDAFCLQEIIEQQRLVELLGE
ncbi:MAG: histidine phosphatase family protein [Coriobacteriaceae bacterium]|nr:histidine phosphatase family protein [Coriobacteriaceae bacterium]